MYFYYGEIPSVRASSRPANHQLVVGAVLANGECEGGGTSSRGEKKTGNGKWQRPVGRHVWINVVESRDREKALTYVMDTPCLY